MAGSIDDTPTDVELDRRLALAERRAEAAEREARSAEDQAYAAQKKIALAQEALRETVEVALAAVRVARSARVAASNAREVVVTARRETLAARHAARLHGASRDEYQRALREYRQLMRHRIANPLQVIEGDATTLQDNPRLDDQTRARLLADIAEQARRVGRIALEPSALEAAEGSLDPRPRL